MRGSSADLVVGVFDGAPVFLQDVADVEDGPDEVANYVRHGWGPAARFHASRVLSWNGAGRSNRP